MIEHTHEMRIINDFSIEKKCLIGRVSLVKDKSLSPRELIVSEACTISGNVCFPP